LKIELTQSFPDDLIIQEDNTLDQKSISGLKKESMCSLFDAVTEGDLDQTKFLIQEGSDPLLENDVEVTPFHIALKGQNLDVLKEVAKAISVNLKKDVDSKQRNVIYNVWVGYVPNPLTTQLEFEDTRIVAILNDSLEHLRMKTFHNIPIVYRQKNEVSSESRKTSRFENINANIEHNIPGETVKSLFEEHSKLSIIHSSSFRSTNFREGKSQIHVEACVALYCQIKGIVPLGERLFPKSIGNLPTDVREGYCEFVGRDTLIPGTEITSQCSGKRGSIGGFLEYKNGKAAFITAAHVVVGEQYLKYDEEQQNQVKTNQKIVIYGSASNPIGEVTRWCFDSNNVTQTSIDAALVEMTESVLFDNVLSSENKQLWEKAGENKLAV